MKTQRISLFPLAGALLFPGSHLPLHIFEPRYKALVSDALARDRLIGMVQPMENRADRPELYSVGCLGRIVECNALDGGEFDIMLLGLARFHIRKELDVVTLFRQVEADVEADDAPDTYGDALAPVMRAALEREARRFADHLGYTVDWPAVLRLDDRTLVNGIAQVAPFDVASKQALLEADTLAERTEREIQLMEFYGRADPDSAPTLQ